MALTELQRPNKADFYRAIQNPASEMDKLISRWRNLVEFIDLVDGTELDTIGVPAGTGAGTVRDDLLNFRTLLSELLSFYDGNSVTPTNVPSAVIDRIRHI